MSARVDSPTPAPNGDDNDPDLDARSVRVFVSYAHEDETYGPRHKDQVLALADLLARKGFDVQIDRWNTAVRRDWPQWTTGEIKKADFVLAVASRNYLAAAEGRLPPDRNRGVQHELAILRELLNADRSFWFHKILPTVMPDGDVAHIPLFLQPTTGSHYRITSLDEEGFKDLL